MVTNSTHARLPLRGCGESYGLRPLPPAPDHCSLLQDCRVLALLLGRKLVIWHNWWLRSGVLGYLGPIWANTHTHTHTFPTMDCLDRHPSTHTHTHTHCATGAARPAETSAMGQNLPKSGTRQVAYLIGHRVVRELCSRRTVRG